MVEAWTYWTLYSVRLGHVNCMVPPTPTTTPTMLWDVLPKCLIGFYTQQALKSPIRHSALMCFPTHDFVLKKQKSRFP